jgi:hypothetical protein
MLLYNFFVFYSSVFSIKHYQTQFPPRISPLVTDDIVFADYIPFTEKANAKTKSNIATAKPTSPTKTMK